MSRAPLEERAVGKELTDPADKGVVMVSWIWQAGGVASRGKPIVEPEDAKGMKVRGGSREMDLILKEAGAAVVTCRRTKSTPPCRPARWTRP
jgi:TRAP-type C4-dicarboxylate transport system substrate-binding protein